MKKIYWIFLFLVLGYWASGYSAGYGAIKVRDNADKQAASQINIMRRIKATYNAINENIDYILTARGAVKTIVVLSPFLMLYCRYFDADPIQDLINYIIRGVGKAEEIYRIQNEMGKTQAFWETLKNQPLSTLSVTAKKILDKTVYAGLPFMAGIMFKLGVGSK
jgi:hypothetical protein